MEKWWREVAFSGKPLGEESEGGCCCCDCVGCRTCKKGRKLVLVLEVVVQMYADYIVNFQKRWGTIPNFQLCPKIWRIWFFIRFAVHDLKSENASARYFNRRLAEVLIQNRKTWRNTKTRHVKLTLTFFWRCKYRCWWRKRRAFVNKDIAKQRNIMTAQCERVGRRLWHFFFIFVKFFWLRVRI